MLASRTARALSAALALAPTLSPVALGQTLVLEDTAHLGIDDFEITPDGRYAVGRENRSEARALVVDLALGQLVATVSGPVGSSSSGPAVDAVVVTNERAVVLGGDVLVLDLTQPTSPLLASHGMGLFPRDVALTPDGTRAVVRGGTGGAGGQFVIDLASGALLASHPGNEPVPLTSSASFEVDCVAATDTHAVATSYLGAGPGTRVTLWELGAASATVAFETSGAGDLAGGPHDVAITPDGTLAVVRSERELAAYDLTVSPPALAFRRTISGSPGPFLDVALDSLAVTDERIVTLAYNTNAQLGSFGTQVEVYDRTGASGYDRVAGVPHDLTLTPDGSRALVRTSEAVYLYDLAAWQTPLFPHADAAVAPGPGTGYFAGLDSIVATDERAVALLQVPGVDAMQVRIFDLAGGGLQPIQSPILDGTRPLDLELTPDGTRVVAGGTDGTAIVHLASGAVLYYDTVPVPGGGGGPSLAYPWCDGVAVGAGHVVGFGYLTVGIDRGWLAVVDTGRFDQPFCTATPSSSGTPARLRAHGSASVAANELTLVVDGAPARAIGAFAYSSSAQQVPFGDGFLCLAGTPVDGGAVVTTFAGGASTRLDLRGTSPIGPGSTWSFQFLFRDPTGGPNGFNASSATVVTFGP